MISYIHCIHCRYKYNWLDDTNKISKNAKTIHKYTTFGIAANEPMQGIVIILRPGRYHDMHDLTNTLNHDFNILGINNLINFEYSNAEYNFVFLLHINEQIERCVFSSNLFQLMDIRKRKKSMSYFNYLNLLEEEFLYISKKSDIFNGKCFKKHNIFGESILKDPNECNEPHLIGVDIKLGKYVLTDKLKQDTYLPTFIKIYCFQLNEIIESFKYS